MINCLVVDDEYAAIDVLKHHIEKVPILHLAASTGNPLEVQSIIENKNIELIFLDIQMPDITGVELIKIIPNKTKVILTTAYSEYAVDGFELGVVDYLLKPISLPRFIIAAQKAMAAISTSATCQNDAYVEVNHIYVKTEMKGKLLRIDFEEIDFVEGMKNYVAIHRGKEKILTLINLKDIEEILPKAMFMRIHKSFIINLTKISSIEGNRTVLRNCTATIPFGETYKTTFLEAIKNKVL
jgi:two-component system LytT family response regulator